MSVDAGAVILNADEADSRDMTTRTLQHAGYTVREASTGPEALEVAVRRAT